MFRNVLRVLTSMVLGWIIVLFIASPWCALTQRFGKGEIMANRFGISIGYFAAPGYRFVDRDPTLPPPSFAEIMREYFFLPNIYWTGPVKAVSIPWWIVLPLATGTAVLIFRNLRRRVFRAFDVEMKEKPSV